MDCFKCVGEKYNRRCEAASCDGKNTYKNKMNCEFRCGTRLDKKVWPYKLKYSSGEETCNVEKTKKKPPTFWEKVSIIMTNSNNVPRFIIIYVSFLLLNIALTFLITRVRKNVTSTSKNISRLLLITLVVLWISKLIPYVGLPIYIVNIMIILVIIISTQYKKNIDKYYIVNV